MSIDPGVLYIVATPIGNREDMSQRAINVLQQVDLIAAEDTRHSRPLLNFYGVQTRLQALHEHNEQQRVPDLVERLQRGLSIALISDAGTPLISDPGYPLVRACRDVGLRVVPVPGVSAIITALSVSGLPTDRFVFEGFLPARGGARTRYLQALLEESRTLVFYESKHRILDSLLDMQTVFGEDRQVVVARELTKTFETIKGGTLAEILSWIQADSDQQRGEFVIMLHGYVADKSDELNPEHERVLRILLADLPVKQATHLAAEILDARRNDLYKLALQIKE
ncbi:MAG: 16S rRNA (cytidine(1402)-2'-O)-methyltransferase [Gammaproteobacteria bacterium]|nr:16S rRNA (cytidine(1402)-2'-O)-methyltransferase [Gammaproteobacteria bacterium]